MKTPEEMAEEWAKAWRYEEVCHFALGNLRLCEYAQNEVQRRLNCGFLAGYKAAQQWISVKDRLPEDWDCVLWLAGTDGRFECGREKNECANSACKTGCGQSFGAGAVFICEFHRKDKHHEQHYLIDDNNDIAFIDCFTHWMPLPIAPKGER